MLVPALCKKAFLQFEALISSNGEVALFSKKKLGKVEVLIVQDSPKLEFFFALGNCLWIFRCRGSLSLKNNKIKIKGYKSYKLTGNTCQKLLSTCIKNVLSYLSELCNGMNRDLLCDLLIMTVDAAETSQEKKTLNKQTSKQREVCVGFENSQSVTIIKRHYTLVT